MISTETFYENLKKIRTLREAKSELTEKSKALTKEIEALSGDLIEYFDLNDIPRQCIDGSMFYVNRTPCYSINEEEAFFRWMNESGDIEMCKSFNAKKFGAYYKEKKANDEELPPGVSVYIKQDVRVRKDSSSG